MVGPKLLTPPGQGDDGRPDSRLRAAMESGDRTALAVAIPSARVFVGVEAALVGSDVPTGADKVSEMALVTLRTPSGATALPVFSGTAGLSAWRASVRPVPVALPDACSEAVRLGLDAVVIDVGEACSLTLEVAAALTGAPDAAGGDARRGRGPRSWGASVFGRRPRG